MKSYLLKLLFFFSLILVVYGCRNNDRDNEVKPQEANLPPVQTRKYYIAAEEVVWDYVPQNKNVFTGKPFNKMDSMFAVRIPSGPTPRIGDEYIKARYIEYTDSTFTTRKQILPEWQHLGILGPVIRANVGDSIHVYFKNNTTIRASIHVHGIFYDKGSEGSDNASNTIKSVVEPGGSHMYRYFAREGSGPGPGQGSSNLWVYHSGVNTDQSDLFAGMAGAIIITRRDMADVNAKPRDVDRELVTLYTIFDENKSDYLQENIAAYLLGFTNPDPADFEMSNKKHSINGMIMGNLPGLTMNKGEKVRWYVLGLGGEMDLHTAHWHGNVAVMNQRNVDVVELLPASAMIADMVPDDPGTWAYHCHVSDHAAAGMDAFYTVNP